MFGIFLNKSTPINALFLLSAFIFSFISVFSYFNSGLLHILTYSFVGIYVVAFYRLKTNDNNNFYREFIFLILLIFNLSNNLTINELGFFFAFTVFTRYIFLNYFKEISFFYSLGIFSGICLVSDPLITLIIIGLFFILNFYIFNFRKFTNFLLGVSTSVGIFWSFIFLTRDLSLFGFNFNSIVFNPAIINFSTENYYIILKDYLIISPIIAVVVYVFVYYNNKKFVFNDFDIKKSWIIFSLIFSIVLGTVSSNKTNYSTLLNCYPISYLIGNYLTVTNYKTATEKRYKYTREIILAIILISVVLLFVKNNTLFLNLQLNLTLI